MRRYTVLVVWDPEVSAYSIVVPALPGCTSQGDTVAEALANGREAIELYLNVLEERGESIPKVKVTEDEGTEETTCIISGPWASFLSSCCRFESCIAHQW